MLTLFGKKKVTEDKIANAYVNAILNTIAEGFTDVAELINTDPEFVSAPHVDPKDHQAFLLIVIAGNLKFIPQYFESGQDKRIEEHAIAGFSHALGIDKDRFREIMNDYRSFLSRVNHPSKKTLYAMSKAVFYKYELNPYQKPYFKSLNTPNPIFLKRLDDIMENFLWSWDGFLEKYKVCN